MEGGGVEVSYAPFSPLRKDLDHDHINTSELGMWCALGGQSDILKIERSQNISVFIPRLCPLDPISGLSLS